MFGGHTAFLRSEQLDLHQIMHHISPFGMDWRHCSNFLNESEHQMFKVLLENASSLSPPAHLALSVFLLVFDSMSLSL